MKVIVRLVFLVFSFAAGNACMATPVNDDPCGAISLDVNTSCIYTTYNNNLATASPGLTDPGCGNYNGADVWFKISIPNNGYHVVVDLQAGVLSDLAMAVYSGTDCNNLNLLNCDANSGLLNMPSLTIDDGCLFAEANNEFWIRVWDENGDENGSFDICAHATTPSVPVGVVSCGGNPITGNNCCDALLLTDNLDGYCGNTGGYTASIDSVSGCAYIENNSWIAFIAEETDVEIGITSSNCIGGMGVQAVIFETTDCTNLNQVSNCWNPGSATTGSLIANGLTPGETYYLMVDGWNGDVCDYTLSIISGVLTTSATAADTMLCLGQSTALSANVYGVGPYTYSWSPVGSLDDPTIATPIATPTSTTLYTVTVSSPAETIIESVQIQVDNAMPGPSTVTGSVSVCQNTTNVGYTASSSDATHYNWTVTGGGTIVGDDTQSTLTINWGMTGGNVCVTASNECGTASEVCLNVGVVAPPDMVVSDPPNGCAPGSVDLSDASITNNNGGIGLITYYANFSDAQNSSPQLPSSAVNTGGTYWVRMDTGTDCYDIASVTATIEDPQIVTVDPQPVCSPTMIDLDTDVWKNETNGWPGGTYTWFADSLDAVNNQNQLGSTAVAASGPYWARYETASGCFDVAGTQITIEEGPDISTAGPVSICDNASIDISTVVITDANNTTAVVSDYYDTESFAVQGWTALAMSSTVVSSPGVYYLRYETANGCWDTAHIVVQSAVAPGAVLSGGGAVCPGGNGTLTFTLTGVGPFDLVYSDGTNNFTLNGISSPHTETVTINNAITYSMVSVSDAGNCAGTVSGSASFTNGNPPDFALSGSTTICSGDDAVISFDLSGNGPFDVVYNDGSSDIPLTGIANGHTITVSPSGNTTYTAVSATDANGCVGTLSGNATVDLHPDLQVVNLQENCSGDNSSYVVSFMVEGGDPGSYQVSGSGTFDSGTNTFTSNSITSGGTYSFAVSDANCGPIDVDGAHACDCTTAAGLMGTTTKYVCQSASVTMNYDNGEALDVNDVLGFVLHDSPGPGLGNVWMTNSIPVFSYAAPLVFEQTYYVSAVVGNDDGTGFPVLDNGLDPCLSISAGQPVVFFSETEATISAPPAVCEGGMMELTFNFTGTGNYNIEYNDGTNDFDLSGITDGHTVTVPATDGMTYTLTQVSNTNVPFCTGVVPPSGSMVTVNLSQQPTVTNLVVDCDDQNLNYTISFELIGGYVPGYSVTGDGTLSGNMFTSDPIAEGTAYNFQIEDGVCPPFDISDTHTCDCMTSVGSMGTDTLSVCESQTVIATYDYSENMDSDDAMAFVLHDVVGPGLGNVYAINSTPEFGFAAPLNYGQVYYVSAVVGNDDGNGFPVLDNAQDECLAISLGQPVAFFPETEAGISGPSTHCLGDTSEIVFHFSKPGTYDVELSDGVSTVQLTDIGDGHIWEVSPVQAVTYTLVQATLHEAPHCAGQVDGTNAQIAIDVFEGPQLGNIMLECDDQSVNYTISFEISGGDAANYAVVGVNGTLAGNQFVSDPLPGGTAYDIQVGDGGPCPAELIGSFQCNCMPDMQPLFTIDMLVSCFGESDGEVSVSPFSGTAPFSYVWSNGTAGTSASQLPGGWHQVTMTDAFGCEAVDSIYLDEPASISADFVTTDPACFGDDDGSILFTNVIGGSGGYQFALDANTSFQGNLFYDLEAGWYIASVQDEEGCTWSDSVLINSPEPFVVTTGEDQQIILGDSVALEVNSSAPLDSFYWSPVVESNCLNCLTQHIYPHSSTSFTLTAMNENGCVASDNFTVIVTKDNPVFVPNAFSPNRDGINDYLNIYVGKSVRMVKSFNIYTRWGEILFTREQFMPDQEDMGWNGYFKGREMGPGVYVYYAEIEFVDGSTTIISGDITLLK